MLDASCCCKWMVDSVVEGACVVTPVVPQHPRDWEECQLVQIRRSAASLRKSHIFRALAVFRCSGIVHEEAVEVKI